MFGAVIGVAELIHYLHTGTASYPISTLALGLLLLGAGVGQPKARDDEDYPTPPDLRERLKRPKREHRDDTAEKLEQLEEGSKLAQDLEDDL